MARSERYEQEGVTPGKSTLHSVVSPSTSSAIPSTPPPTTHSSTSTILSKVASLFITTPRRSSPRLSKSTPPPLPPSTSDPDSAARHAALAAELFPPSPPTATAPRERSVSPEVIEDSEPDLPSAIRQRARGGKSTERTQRWRRRSSVDAVRCSESGEEDGSSDDSPIEVYVERTTVKVSTVRGVEKDDGSLGLSSLVLEDHNLPKSQPPTPKVRFTTDDRTPSISPVLTRTKPTTASRPSRSTSTAKKPTIECICLSDSDSDDEVAISTPKQREVLQPDDDEEEEYDPNAGVLTYEPTPRSRKPLRIGSRTPSSTPTKGRTPTRNQGRKIGEIDLTGSDTDGDSDEYTPSPITPRRNISKPLFLPTLALPKPTATPGPKSTALLTPSERIDLPLQLIRELDKLVFRREWAGLRIVGDQGEGLPEGIAIRWNNKLRNTAGRASWKTSKLAGVTTHHTSIDLATKVTDTPEKLAHTLAHELCHVAAWVLSDEIKPSHGAAFKLWAARIMSLRSDIQITTTHSYEISYKYRWRCTFPPCSKIFSRHSKSIDPSTHGCPCGNKLVAIDQEGGIKPSVLRAPKSSWQEYLSVMGPKVRLERPGIETTEVFKVVGVLWAESKALAIEHEKEKEKEKERRGLEEGMKNLSFDS